MLFRSLQPPPVGLHAGPVQHQLLLMKPKVGKEQGFLEERHRAAGLQGRVRVVELMGEKQEDFGRCGGHAASSLAVLLQSGAAMVQANPAKKIRLLF